MDLELLYRELTFFGLWELIFFGPWELLFFGPWQLMFLVLGFWELVFFGLWELMLPLGFGLEGSPGGARGPNCTFNKLRLMGRKLLSI